MSEQNLTKDSGPAEELEIVDSNEQDEENGAGETETIHADLEKFRDLAARTAADFDNYRKRTAREKEDAIRYANTSFLEKLIPVLDNFELGLDAARNSGEGAAILSGMSMVLKQMQDLLTSSGVEVLDAAGQAFDPNLHEALGQEESDTVPEGHVTRQLRRGYKLRDRLLRPANVLVSKGPAA